MSFVRLTAIRFLVAALIAWPGFATAEAPPPPTDTAVFLMRQGEQIVSAEWHGRTGATLSSSAVVNSSSELSFRQELGDDGAAERIVVELPQAGQKPALISAKLSAAPQARDEDAKAGIGLFFDQAPAGMLEHLVRFARSSGKARFEGKLYRWVDGKSVPATVTFTGRDRASVEVAGKEYRLVVDEIGRLIAGQLPDYGITIERLASASRSELPLWGHYDARPGATYTAQPVSIRAPQGHTLAGTLTVPLAPQSRIPAFVLITGSGRSHRNASSSAASPNAPFRQIADALSSRGVAVLRIDDRGTGESTGDWSKATTLDEAEDVRSAVKYLRGRSDIDQARIGLLGLSEGSMIATLIAAEDPQIAALILMCAPSEGAETVDYQIRYDVDRDPTIKAHRRDEAAAEVLRKQYTSPRAQSILALNTLPAAARLKSPVLLLHGTTDRQVPPWSATRLAAAIRTNGNSAVEVQMFPLLNHLFLRDPIGRGSGYGFLPSMCVPQDVLDTIGEWGSSSLLRQ